VRRRLQGWIELERLLVGLLRLGLLSFLLVDGAEEGVRAGGRRLVLLRRVREGLLQRLFAARQVRGSQRSDAPEGVESGHITRIELERRLELRRRCRVVFLDVCEILAEEAVGLR